MIDAPALQSIVTATRLRVVEHQTLAVATVEPGPGCLGDVPIPRFSQNNTGCGADLDERRGINWLLVVACLKFSAPILAGLTDRHHDAIFENLRQ